MSEGVRPCFSTQYVRMCWFRKLCVRARARPSMSSDKVWDFPLPPTDRAAPVSGGWGGVCKIALGGNEIRI